MTELWSPAARPALQRPAEETPLRLVTLLCLVLLMSSPPMWAEPPQSAAEALTSGKAWSDFNQRIEAVGKGILGETFPGSPTDRAEGYRHLARMVAMALQWEVDFADPLFPAFYRHDDDVTRWGGPNVDNTYLRARINGEATYRISGNVTGIHDLIISTRNGDMHDGKTGVAGDLDRGELPIQPDGRFEILVGPKVEAGKGIRTSPDTDHVGIRQYFYDWSNESPGVFHIERISEGPAHPDRVSPEEMARRLDRAADWVEKTIFFWNDFMRNRTGSFPNNQVVPPASVPGGASDIFYGAINAKLGEDEALLIEMEPPDARYWSLQWYTFGWFESPDFVNRQTSLNGAQARVDADGKVRIVVSSRDPWIQNWIDNEGRERIAMNFRWIWSKNNPTPTAKVIPLKEVGKHLPKGTPVFDKDARKAQIQARRTHLERRFRR